MINICIVVIAIISGLIYGYKSKETVKESLLFVCLDYYVVSTYRMLQGHGNELLCEAFDGKGIMAYIKVALLILAVEAIIVIARRIVKSIADLCFEWCSIFSCVLLLYVACIGLAKLKAIAVLGLVALVVAIIVLVFAKKSIDSQQTITTETLPKDAKQSNIEKNDRLNVILAVTAWIITFVILGPSEIYAYNTSDFMFKYVHVLPHLLMFAASIIAITYLFSWKIWSATKCKVLSGVIAGYTLLSYIQTMFLNGSMNTMEGTEQVWDSKAIYINLTLWIVLLIIVIALVYKKLFFEKICKYLCGVIALLQLLGLISILFGGNVINENKPQLTKEGIFTQAKQGNIVVFILDTYDSQMVERVQEADADFYEPMKDFTFYNNMVSRFGYTDGSLPYLLTGILAENRYTEAEYKQSNFMANIKDAGYDIRICTEGQYTAPLAEGIVENNTDKYSMKLRPGRTVQQMINCCRYRGLPFVLKNLYSYDQTDFVECIDNSDLYIFGKDADFYHELVDTQISIDADINHAFRMYHLYGAHSPYNLKEDYTYDYNNQDAVGQWKASFGIVYEYIDQMKAAGTYESSTIIVMADHGPNVKQRASLEQMGIHMDEELRPIFFIKYPGEENAKLSVDNLALSHDDYFDFINKAVAGQNGWWQ